MMRIYDRCPQSIQTIGINIYDVMDWLTNHSKSVEHYLSRLEQLQKWTKDDLEEYQNSRLREMLRYAYREIPFYSRYYKENNVDISKVKTIQDLEKLPIITKSDISKHWHSFLPKRRIRSRNSYTSGTTGMPLEIKLSHDCFAIGRASSLLRNLWAGHNGEPIARFVGDRPVSECSDKSLYRKSYVMNRLIFPSYCLSSQNFDRIIGPLAKHGVQYIQCYPSTIFILAKFLQSQDEYFPLKGLLYGSEPLHRFQRELIEDRFQAKAFGFYGQAEMVVSALECEHHNYHLTLVDGILEVVKGDEKLAPGERGHTVGTTLCNFAMPLIRYRMDDFTGFIGDRCECGRNSPVIFPIETRSNDLIVTPSGTVLPPGIFGQPMLELQHVTEAQIVQKRVDRIVVKVVPSDGYSSEEEMRLLGALRECLGEEMSIEVERVSKIHRSGSFKKRWIVSELSGDPFERAMELRPA